MDFPAEGMSYSWRARVLDQNISVQSLPLLLISLPNSLADLEGRSLKSVSLGQNQGVGRALLLLEALGENLSLASSSFWWLPAFLDLWPLHTAQKFSASFETLSSSCVWTCLLCPDHSVSPIVDMKSVFGGYPWSWAVSLNVIIPGTLVRKCFLQLFSCSYFINQSFPHCII